MSELIKSTFDEVCRGYDGLEFFPRSASSFVRRLKLAGNEQVLDVATGTGHLAFLLAQQVPQGTVTAIDFSRGMLECARQKADAEGFGNIAFQEMDMEQLDFTPGAFDLAACSFGIFFIEDIAGQLKKIANVVRPGGTLAIATFEENHYFNPLVDLMLGRLESFGVQRSPQAWKQVASKAGCRDLLAGAGLTDIIVEYENVGYYLQTAGQWWNIVWNGGMRRLFNQLSDEQLKRFRAEHLEEIEERKTSEGIWLDVGVLFSSGHKQNNGRPQRAENSRLSPRGPGSG